MKKTISTIIAVIVIFALTLSFVSCCAEELSPKEESLPIGTVFHALNADGIDIAYTVIGDRECQTGDDNHSAIDTKTTGRLIIPRRANGYHVTKISRLSFQGCNKITEVVIPQDIESLPNSCFDACTSLSYVELHEGLTSIGKCAFSACPIEMITIPSTVKSIDKGAFMSCSKLKVCRIKVVEPFEIHKVTFTSDLYDIVTLIVPQGSKSDYAKTECWSLFKTIIEE